MSDGIITTDIMGEDERGAVAVVTDDAGQPVWGARLTIVRRASSASPKETDEQGRCEFSWSDPGENPPLRFLARAPGFALSVSESFKPAAEAVEVPMVLGSEEVLPQLKQERLDCLMQICVVGVEDRPPDCRVRRQPRNRRLAKPVPREKT